MVTLISKQFYENRQVGDDYLAHYRAEYAGTSQDTKPTEGIVSGSSFLEVDTGDIYIFDETSGAGWTKQFSLQD